MAFVVRDRQSKFGALICRKGFDKFVELCEKQSSKRKRLEAKMTKMTHKEMTAHIRGRMKAQGIHARVKMNEACGTRYITIVTPTYEARWTSEELKAIAICANVNRLTSARKMPIDIRNIAMLTGTTQINFEFHG